MLDPNCCCRLLVVDAAWKKRKEHCYSYHRTYPQAYHITNSAWDIPAGYAKSKDLAVNVQQEPMSSIKDPSGSSLLHDERTNMHDCLALGALEYGLPYLKMSTLEADVDVPSEIHRLPLLLRILSQSRPLSSIQSLGDLLLLQNEDSLKSDASSTNHDSLLDDVVARLEDRAAIYAAAEHVQMVSCHIAPAACHRLSKLPPLSKRRSRQPANPLEFTSYDTNPLEVVARSLLDSSDTGSKKQRRLSLTKQSTVGGNVDLEEQESELDENDDEDALRGRRTDELDDSDGGAKAESSGLTGTGAKKRKRVGNTRALSINNLSEDSPEYNVVKVLHELISLTVTSLQNEEEHEKLIDTEDSKIERTSLAQANDSSSQNVSSLALPKMDDSILAEPARRVKSLENSSSSGNAKITSTPADLASNVVALMHHAPVLQHGHVASALCRAALPQTPILISRMGANCPATVPCLLDGCITVYCWAVAESALFKNNLVNAGASPTNRNLSSNIASACVQSARLLAKLSPREAHRTMSTLRHRNVMLELQLELMIQHDELAALVFVNQQLSAEASSSSTTEDESLPQSVTTLSGHLQQSASLLKDALHLINSHLTSECIRGVRLLLALSSYIRILFRVSMTSIFEQDGIGVLLQILASLQRKLELLREEFALNLQQPEVPSSGLLYILLIASIVSTYAVLLSNDEFLESSNAAPLKDLLEVEVSPPSASIFFVRLSLSLFYGDEDSLYDIIDSSTISLSAKLATCTTSQRDSRFRTLLKKLCTWAVNPSCLTLQSFQREFGISLHGNSTLLHPSVSLQMLKYERSTHASATNLLERVLTESEAVLLFIRDPLVLEFVESGVSIGVNQEVAKVPVVTHVQICSLASSLLLPQWEHLEIPVLQFLMQLLYCFFYLEKAPTSPFCIDPRELPLSRILEIGVRFEDSERIHSSVCVKLADFIDRHCPEVRRFHRFKMLKSRERFFQKFMPAILVKKSKQEFKLLLRQSIASVPQCDASGGLSVEQAFLEASLFLSDADLMSVTVSALVSNPSSLPLCFTYPMLYRDPLVVLKCPLTVWSCRGTRRVALNVLSSLLVTNEFMVRKGSVSADAANELLCSRNEIVLRCLLRVMTSLSPRLSRSAFVCTQTCSLIRRLVATNEGLIAVLIKQGLTVREMDWLIESIPEIALDLSTIQGILTEKNSLSAANRLVVADCCAWIGIAHGYRSNGYAEAIVHACLSQLISSFFLILGPIGVPVNALVGQGNDLDATQVARKAAFHLLSSLQKIKPFRTQLKAETSTMLQKFLGMCKGESIVGSFQTSITGSQKSILKDLVDIVRKAMESMGLASSIQD